MRLRISAVVVLCWSAVASAECFYEIPKPPGGPPTKVERLFSVTAAEGGLTLEQRYRHCCLAWNCSPLKVILDGEEDPFLCGSGVSLARILAEYRRWREVEWSCVGERLPGYGMPSRLWFSFEKADEALGWLRVLRPAVWWPIDIHIGRNPKVVIRAL